MEPEIGTVCPRCGAICDDYDCECEDDCMIAQWGGNDPVQSARSAGQ